MDIEKMRKMGLLMKELQKHGMAEDSQDAMDRAEQMLKGKIHLQESLEQTESESESGNGLVQVSQVAEKAEPAQDYLLERKFEMQLNTLKQKNEQQLLFANDLMNAMAKEIVDLKKQVELLSQAKQVQHSVKKVVAQREQTHFKKEAKESHPKQGSITPDNVSMDKIFYYGNK